MKLETRYFMFNAQCFSSFMFCNSNFYDYASILV
jgi:hypothetical protein